MNSALEELNNLVMARRLPEPRWEFHSAGSAHAPAWTATATIGGLGAFTATAASKKAARAQAAETILLAMHGTSRASTAHKLAADLLEALQSDASFPPDQTARQNLIRLLAAVVGK